MFLTNDDEVCIPSLSSILLAVLRLKEFQAEFTKDFHVFMIGYFTIASFQ